MKIGINLDIFEEYYKLVRFVNDCPDYSDALMSLNNDMEKIIKSDEFSAKYDGKKARFVLPISDDDCGNIFPESNYRGPCWCDITVWCKIDCKNEDFDKDKFIVDKAPGSFDVRGIIWNKKSLKTFGHSKNL